MNIKHTLIVQTLLYWSLRCSSAAAAAPAGRTGRDILVLGSVNMDITVDVARLPLKGETTTSTSHSVSLAVGGKGANQAVAAARLFGTTTAGSSNSLASTSVHFICRFGNDSYTVLLQQQLSAAGVDVSGCQKVADLGSGQGLVMLEPDGAASSIVVGGANTAWGEGAVLSPSQLSGVAVLLLQREVPESINLAAAQAAHDAGVPVILDAGGSDRPVPPALMHLVSYLCPNELELAALTGSSTDTMEQVVAAARSLVAAGASRVLVTLSERGAVLVGPGDNLLHQPALPVPGGTVVDGTAAGDAFRAGFAVGLVSGWPLQHCMQFAAAAGAIAVSRKGALPSLPTLQEVVQHLQAHDSQVDPLLLELLGQQQSSAASGTCTSPPIATKAQASATSGSIGMALSTVPEECPLKFASRLNSMRGHRDLQDSTAAAAAAADTQHTAAGTQRTASAAAKSGLRDDVLGWIALQGRVDGLSLVDLNYPQHLKELDLSQLKAALQQARLAVGAINIRFPERFLRGAFTNPDPALRSEAVALAAEGCNTAVELGSDQVVVWSPYDGYDYYLQIDHDAAWHHTVEAYKQLMARCPTSIRVSVEFKPTDPATRFAVVPNTATALALAHEVGAQNFGVMLDIGHMLMASENPAQSIAMAARAGKLFGIHVNDAHVRLGAEDGLAFGAVNPLMALEVVLQLQKSGYRGYIYFDTFPTMMDAVHEAIWNVWKFRSLWRKAAQLSQQLAGLSAQQDALGVLRLLEAAEDLQQQHKVGSSEIV